MRPVVAIYSTFLQRAFDQIVHDVCLQKAPVIFAIDRAGLVGHDGHTHHGTFDIAFLRLIPNMVLMMPKDENELQHMLYTAIKYTDGPIAIRYPRGEGVGVLLDEELHELPIGRGELLRDGVDAIIVALGDTVYRALAAADKLRDECGYSIGVVNARFIKPLDLELLTEVAQTAKRIVTLEEHSLHGGFGSAVLEALHMHGLHNVPVMRLGIRDQFVEHGPPDLLRAKHFLDAGGIARLVREWLEAPASAPTPMAMGATF